MGFRDKDDEEEEEMNAARSRARADGGGRLAVVSSLVPEPADDLRTGRDTQPRRTRGCRWLPDRAPTTQRMEHAAGRPKAVAPRAATRDDTKSGARSGPPESARRAAACHHATTRTILSRGVSTSAWHCSSARRSWYTIHFFSTTYKDELSFNRDATVMPMPCKRRTCDCRVGTTGRLE